MIENECNMKGFYEFYKNGELVGSSQNTLTDGHMSRFLAGSSRNYYTRCYCGDGTTPPTQSDVGMESFIAGSFYSYAGVSNQARYIDNDDGLYKIMYTYVFPYNATAFSGTVSEVGVRFTGTTSTTGYTVGATVDSRVLVRDELGVVTPITITSSDTFTVVAKFISTIPTTGTGTIRLGDTTHTVDWELLNFNAWEGMIDLNPMIESIGYDSFRVSPTQDLYNDPYSDAITGGTTINEGTGLQYNTVGPTYYDFTTLFVLPSDAVLASGVKYIQFHNDAVADIRIRWGMRMTPPITEATNRNFAITIRWNFTLN